MPDYPKKKHWRKRALTHPDRVRAFELIYQLYGYESLNKCDENFRPKSFFWKGWRFDLGAEVIQISQSPPLTKPEVYVAEVLGGIILPYNKFETWYNAFKLQME